MKILEVDAAIASACAVLFSELAFSGYLDVDTSTRIQQHRIKPAAQHAEQAVSQHLHGVVEYGPWHSAAELWTESTDGRAANTHAQLNELYATRSVGAVDISIGKKVVNWGVGFGFRPLDVIAQQRRNQLIATEQSGRGQLSLETFSATTAWTLIAADTDNNNSPSLSLKTYGLRGSTDWHHLLHYSVAEGMGLGLGVSGVTGDHFSWQASYRYQQRDPRQTQQPVHRALIGGTASWGNGLSLMTEFWYDGASASHTQWQHAWAEHAELSGGPPAALFSGQNLHRRNILLRLAYRRGPVETALENSIMPADGGQIISLTSRYHSPRQTLTLALRHFSGKPQSLSRRLPLTASASLQWKVYF